MGNNVDILSGPLEIPRKNAFPELTYIAARQDVAGIQSTLKTLAHRYFAVPWEDVPWHLLPPNKLAIIRKDLLRIYKPSTVRKMFSHLMGIYEAAFLGKLISGEDYTRIKLAMKHRWPRQAEEPEGGLLRKDQLLDLLASLKDDKRTRAMVALMACAGLRRVELTRILVLDVEEHAVLVKGKGGHERRVPLNGGPMRIVKEWLNGEGYLFPGPKGPLTVRRITALFKNRCEAVGMGWLTCHSFRRFYATTLLEHGYDVLTVANLLGHADLASVARYDRRPWQVRVEAVEKTFGDIY